jgi:integrase
VTRKTAAEARIAELQAELARLTAPTKQDTDRHRQSQRLTVRETIARLGLKGFYADGNNLYLDAKSLPGINWVFRFKRNGVAHDMGLGPWPLVGLAEARELALDCRRKLRAGIDPLAEKRAARAAALAERTKAMTFKQCAERYIAAFEANWKNSKHAAQWPSTLETYAYPVIGALPVAAIDTALVMKVIEPIWYDKAETASRVRGRIERVLGWAATSGYRPKGDNPARWKDHLDNLLPKRSAVAPGKHHAALPWAELPGFMARLAQQDGLGALALRFTILTGTRTNESLKARWGEVDLAERLWIIPAERMKTGREHRVPLADATMEILRTLQRLPPSDFVFPANRRRPVSDMIMLQLLKRMGRSDLTVHGFRSTFSDWVAERTNFASELREMALAHAISNKVEAAYRRGDLFEKRRQLANAWARFATSPAPAGQVVPLVSADRPA